MSEKASLSETPRPRLYLNTPFLFEPAPFAEALARALEAGDVACVRLRLRGASEDELRYAVEALKPVCHERDVALILADAFRLAAEMGLDGVHFEEGKNAQIEARAALGPEAIIGVGCGASRDRGLTAGERGASYVAFGPVAQEESLRVGDLAEPDLFAWWQTMIELPVVAEGGMTPALAAELTGKADFIAACRSVWDAPEGPAAAVAAYQAAIDEAAAADELS
ncbi:MAG: thiamine phosphate synthase [Pseudomonadota bacterium]